MARKPRIDLIGFHHVANQGVYKANIFATIIEKQKFLEMVCKACGIYDIILHDYCIMDNHYHLLVETKRENLSYFMRQINGNYAIYFNRKQERSGPLWKGRYKSWFILHEEYLNYTIKYIEYDPIRANLSFFPGDYPFTLSATILGTESIIPCAQKSLMIEKYTERELKAFLQSDLTKDELGVLEDEKRKKVTKDKTGIKLERDKPLKEYFKQIQTKMERDTAMKEAYLDGYTQGVIAKELKITSALVSYCIKKLVD
ncbi:MAG: hypothetical protein HF962_05745 [Sulfurovum sp.]|nr:hypothetical protein [Sulfurovum sp.]